jgi:CheY-like chemotaxis protein
MRRILLIDDDSDMLETTSMVLELGGYEVTCANNGPDGLKHAATIPDLNVVLLDVRMDPMDGIEVLSRLKDQRPELPAIMMTAYAHDSVEMDAYRLGAYTLVRKPFEPDQMLNLIGSAARRPAVLIAADSLCSLGQELTNALNQVRHRAFLAYGEDELRRVAEQNFSDVAVITIEIGDNVVDGLRLANPELRFLYATPAPPPATVFSKTKTTSGFVEWNATLTANDIVKEVCKLRGRGV